MRRDPPRPKPTIRSEPRSDPRPDRVSDAKAKPTAGDGRPASVPAANSKPDRDGAAKLVRVAGLPAVAALFATAPDRVERLYFEPGIGARASAFCKTLAAARKPYNQVTPDELARIAGTPMHGSIVAFAIPKAVLALKLPEAIAWSRTRALLLVLDGVGNPHNLGAIARTAAFFGLPRMVVSDAPGQALPSDAAYRVARGGLEHVPIYQAANLPRLLKALRPHYLVLGAALATGKAPEDFFISPRPLALVMGNEEDGLPPSTLEACEAIVTIPGAGADHMQSLNVAASSAILIHALTGRANR